MYQQDNELIKYEEKLPNAEVDNDSGYSVGLRIWDAEKVSKGRGCGRDHPLFEGTY